MKISLCTIAPKCSVFTNFLLLAHLINVIKRDNMILLAKHKRAKGHDGFSVVCVLFIVKYNHKEKAVFDCVRDNYLSPEDR